VDDVMSMLELDNVGHRLIGEDADSGLSMGERKRVTIGTTYTSFLLLTAIVAGANALFSTPALGRLTDGLLVYSGVELVANPSVLFLVRTHA
jgi:hypothetical protein